MSSRTLKFVSAAAFAVALIATVAVARTVHTRTTAAGAQPAQDSAMSAAPAAMPRPALDGFIACGTLSNSECETLGKLLPM